MQNKQPDIYIATPSFSGEVWVGYLKSIIGTFMALSRAGYTSNHDVMIGCSNICVARNAMLMDFIESGAKTLLFIDADLAWNPTDAVKLVQSPHDVIAGAYPAKDDSGRFMGKFKKGPTRLLEAEGIAGGFLKISRNAIEKMQERFPELHAKTKGGREVWTFFDNGIFDGEYVGEDYAFAKRWQMCGGKCFIDPDMPFDHRGHKTYSGILGEVIKDMAA